MYLLSKGNERDHIELKRFGAAKEASDKAKRQPTGCKETLANDTSGKGVIFKIY